jgi:hypothetical protein
MSNKNFDIRKTFEIFWREPLSVITEGLFQLVNIKDNIFSQKPSLNIDFVDNKTQITVVNSDKMYSLLKTVMYRRKQKALKAQNSQSEKSLSMKEL